MNKILKFTLSLTLLLVLISPVIHVQAATTITVCASGCDYTTIQDAINAAANGDTIQVGAGTYIETIAINKSLILKGEQFGVDVSGRTPADISESTIQGLVTISADNVTINGFTLTNPGQTYAVYVPNNTPSYNTIAIAYNLIDTVGSTGLSSNVHAIHLNRGPDAVTIENNRFNNIKANDKSVSAIGVLDSVSADTSEDLVIQNNIFNDIASATKGAYGIIINNAAGAPGAQILNNTFTTLSGGWTHAIGLEGPTANAVVSGNVFSSLTAAGIDNSAIFFEKNSVGDTVTLTNNQFNGTGFYGIAIHPNDLPGGSNGYNYIVTGETNWWNTSSGPGLGSGALVSPNVDYAPWCADSACTTFAPSVVYVEDDWSGTTVGDDPDGAGPAVAFGYDAFSVIQDAINAAADNATVNVYAGTYAEDLTIDKPISLLGPNSAINPNTGTRVGEATLHPATSGPDPYSTCTVMAYLMTSNITIKGFQFDGDNPALTSGIMIGAADVDACEMIASYEGVGSILVENNILKNATYTAVDFYNYYNSAATSNNYIRYNLIQNLGETTYNWGVGVLVYNNFYADITDNVFDNVRVGIQTGNFEKPNTGSTGDISNNTINAWRLGIFHNLWYSNASNITISDNTVNAIDSTGSTKWNGMLISSFQGSVDTTITNNIINIGSITQNPAAGYNVWNIPTSATITISGGSVTGGDYGVWVNNYAGYSSNASNTAVTVDGVAISNASLAGVYIQDDPLNTNNATVAAEVVNSPVNNSAVGILIEGTDVTAAGMCNQITDNTAGLINSASSTMVFEKNWWGDVTGPSGSGTGTGDSVSANVDYSPWSADTTCTVFTTNQAPVITEGESVNVNMSEDGSPIAFDITLNATDPETDTLTWSILTPASHGTASASGTGNSKVIGYAPVLNYSGTDSFVVLVSDGLAEDTITVNVTINAVNTTPTDIDLSNTNINENSPAATVIGTLSTTDPDVGDTFTYSFCGGTDDAAFGLNGNELLSAEVFDYETKDSYSICIQTTDSGALSYNETLTITVNNLIDTITFIDVPMSYWAWEHIESIYAAGITGGCGTTPLIYCPEQSVNRAQMAVFLLRGIHGSSYTPPAATGTVFNDVPLGSFAGAWIEQLVAEGITSGCGGGNYCPNGLVTRAQMAVFLLRAKYGSGYTPPAATGTVFPDVPSGSFAGAWIEQLVAEGVTSGCGGGNYCPNGLVTRAQMAVFLQRTFNLPLP